MNDSRKRAIICGHTGATGILVLDELVKASWISEIITIGRRSCQKYLNNSKVRQIFVDDMSDLSGINIDEIGKVDLAFDLIATSVKDAFKGEEAYRKVDVQMTSEFARFARNSGAEFLSAIGMVPIKETDYAFKAKTDFENYVRTLDYARLAFMKPMWVNRESLSKWYEKLYMLFSKNITSASDMAKCIVWASKNQIERERSYSIKDMEEIGKSMVCDM